MKDLFDLTDRVAVITGGAGVLGMEFAHALAGYGARVVVSDIDQAKCDACAEDVSASHGTEAVGVAADVSKPEEVTGSVEQTVARFGRIDILVNSAAATRMDKIYTSFEEYPVDVWKQVLEVNITGMFLITQAVGRVMLDQRCGSIINISSIYGVVAPVPSIYEGADFNTPAVYSVSKAGVIGLTRYLAAYWGDKGVRVNSITPGGVFNDHEDPFLAAYNARVPMGRMACPAEPAGAVVFLASDASSYVTGHNLVVDGGWTAW